MTPTLLRATLACALLSSTAGVFADPLLPISDQSALARSFALPELGAAEVLAPKADEFRFAIDWSNEFLQESNASEALVLDGNAQRLAWDWRHGLAHGFEVGLQLPFYVIDDGRGFAPHDHLLYSYSRNGDTLLNASRSGPELGDIELHGGWQALPSLALRTMVKLPSGDSTRLTGGNAGGALWADFDPFAGSQRWLGFISAGGSLNNKGEVIAEQQKHGVGFAGAGIGFRLWQPFALSAQVYAHTRLYDDSSLKALRRETLQGALGARYDVNDHLTLNAGFQKELVADSSPRFGVHLSVVAR